MVSAKRERFVGIYGLHSWTDGRHIIKNSTLSVDKQQKSQKEKRSELAVQNMANTEPNKKQQQQQ